MMTLKYFSIDFDLILSYLITILCSLFVGKQIFLYLRRHFYEPYFLDRGPVVETLPPPRDFMSL